MIMLGPLHELKWITVRVGGLTCCLFGFHDKYPVQPTRRRRTKMICIRCLKEF